MIEVRIITCPDCGGDGGWPIATDVNRVTGALIEHWTGCIYCEETGQVEIEVEPITLEDLEST